MRIAFLRCSVIILLSFLTARAEAQIDSNALVHIYCGPLSGGCTVDAKCGYNPDEYHRFTATIGFDSVLLLSDAGRLGLPSFEIDTNEHKIINLTFQTYTNFYYVDIGDGCLGSLSLSFEPIPFVFSEDSLISIPSRYKCDRYADGSCGYGGPTNECIGSCNYEDSITDNVSFEIFPLRSAVTVPAELANYFRVISMPGQELFSFNDVTFERTMQVSDILGKKIFTRPVPAGQTLDQETLLPGLYFARLGDQVAKFIVPPR